jgi:hypothetical protein
MREEITAVSGVSPASAKTNGSHQQTAATSYPQQEFWLHVYPPLEDHRKVQVPDAHIVCPWSLAAELADKAASAGRRQNILEALKRGLKTIRQYGLPPSRIVFTEDYTTQQITVWVN